MRDRGGRLLLLRLRFDLRLGLGLRNSWGDSLKGECCTFLVPEYLVLPKAAGNLRRHGLVWGGWV